MCYKVYFDTSIGTRHAKCYKAWTKHRLQNCSSLGLQNEIDPMHQILTMNVYFIGLFKPKRKKIMRGYKIYKCIDIKNMV